MSFSPERCPLCGQPNDCQSATQSDYKGPCWCMKETFPPELLARVPEEARRCAPLRVHLPALPHRSAARKVVPSIISQGFAELDAP